MPNTATPDPNDSIYMGVLDYFDWWPDVDTNVADYIEAIEKASGGLIRYNVIDNRTVNVMPVPQNKQHSRHIAPDNWLHNYEVDHFDIHRNGGVDYDTFLVRHDIINFVEQHDIDQVWIFPPPMTGFGEGIMVGRTGWEPNGPFINKNCRRFLMYGFGQDRGMAWMLHNTAHAMEWTVERYYSINWPQRWSLPTRTNPGEPLVTRSLNDWFLFTLTDSVNYPGYVGVSPGNAQLGSCHYTPCVERYYDTLATAPSWYKVWKRYPDLSFDNMDDCEDVTIYTWHTNGSLDWDEKQESFQIWWFSHLPRKQGTNNGIVLNNWWHYLWNLHIDYPR